MLHASETWPIAVVDSARLVTADNAMVRWMCKRKLTDRTRMSDMYRILGIKDLESILRTGRLCWYGHLERQPNDVWPNAVRQMHVDGRASRGRPRNPRKNVPDKTGRKRTKPDPFLSVFVLFCPVLSGFVRFCPFMSVYVRYS